MSSVYWFAVSGVSVCLYVSVALVDKLWNCSRQLKKDLTVSVCRLLPGMGSLDTCLGIETVSKRIVVSWS